MNALDPRAPLVVDIRDLGRRAGATKDLDLTVPVAEGWGAGTAWVPEGGDLDLALRLESVVEGVFVSGTVRTQIVAECARCLEPVSWEERSNIQELFVYPPQDARGHRVTDEGEGSEDSSPIIEDDLLDLEATVRDAVVLGLPIAPLCRVDCPGLCAQCGVALADEPEHRHEEHDPRWAALTALLEDDKHDEDKDN